MADRDLTPPGAEFPLDPELESDLEAQPRVEDQLAAAQAEVDQWREKSLRAQADFENTRRRLQARHDDAVKRAAERVVEGLLPVLDDLDRAIDHAVGVGAANDVADGLGAVRSKLLGVLAREGCEPVDPFGQPFDALRHSAMQQRDDAAVPDGTVIEVFQKGYEMHGRVVRPASVVVSTGGPPRRE